MKYMDLLINTMKNVSLNFFLSAIKLLDKIGKNYPKILFIYSINMHSKSVLIFIFI